MKQIARTQLPAPGRIVVLNGPSSAGKSSIARELQATLPAWSFLHVQLDAFRAMEPADYFIRGQPEVSALRLAALCRALHATCVQYARHGQNVLLDHVLSDVAWTCLIEDLAELPVVLVGVRCPLATLVQREQLRGNRPGGLAASQAKLHDGRIYDVEVDTGALRCTEAAQRIAAWINAHGEGHALRTVAAGNQHAKLD